MAPSFASHAPLSSGWGLVVVLHLQVDPVTAIPLSDDSRLFGRIHSGDSATEWQTNTRRQTLVVALQAAGQAPRPFDDADRAVSSFPPTGIERLLMVSRLPFVLIFGFGEERPGCTK